MMTALVLLASSSNSGNGLETAWFGLGGVIVGALITGVFGYVNLRTRNRADARAESRREDMAVHRAARLIDADLLFAETAARICVEKKHWWSTDRRLTSEGWQQYRDVIASKLQWADWLAVMVAVEAVGHLQGSRDGALKIQLAEMAIDPKSRDIVAAANALGLDIADPNATIPDSTVKQIEPMFADLQKGRAALAGLTKR